MSIASETRRRARFPADDDLRREAAILAHCRHPGVVELRSVEESDGEVTLVVAEPPGVPLGTIVLTVEELAGVIAVLATTVADLHDIGVAHGSLRLDAVTIAPDGRPVVRSFEAARWLTGSPGRWPGHPLAMEDDRALGAIATALVERCAPLEMLHGLEGPARGVWRRLWHRPPSGASAIVAWAAAAAAGEVRARRLATVMAEEMPGACLPDPGRGRPTATPALAQDAAVLGDDHEADAAIDAWLSAPDRPLDCFGPEVARPDPRAGDRQQADAPGQDPDASHPLARGPVTLAAIVAVVAVILAAALAVVRPARPRWARPVVAAAPATLSAPPRPSTPARLSTPAHPSAPAHVPPPAAVAAPTSVSPRTPVPPTVPRGPLPIAPAQFCLDASTARGPTPACTIVTYVGGVLTVGSARFAVGQAGDLVTTGRWTCGTTPTLALLRPSTGQIWIFPSWPGGPQAVAPVAAGPVPSGRLLAARPDGTCDRLAVTRADGTVSVLGPWTA